MFSIFPDGLSGVGLAILRLVLGAVLTIRALAFLRDRHDMSLVTTAVVLLMLLSAALIVTGYRTRPASIAAAAAIVGAMISFNGLPSLGILDTRTTEVFAIATALAVACLGPGAFSLDSRLFGRREIVIPRSSTRN